MVRHVLLGFLTVSFLTLATSGNSWADDASDCQSGRSEARIKGCSSIIKSGRLFGRPVSKQGLVVAYNNRASAYAAKGNFDHAITDYTKAIDLDPTFAQAYFNRGIAFGNKNQADKAIADYDKAIRLDSKFADAYNNRGLAYHFKGNFDRAIVDYGNAVRINPKYATAYNNRGDAHEKKGEFKKASADYNKALQIDPSHKAARYNLKQLKTLIAAKKKTTAPKNTPKIARVEKSVQKSKTQKIEPFKAGTRTFSLKIDGLKKADWQRLGVRVATLTDQLGKALGLHDKGGALIIAITPSSPAHKSGIHPADVLLSLNGQDIADQQYPTNTPIETTPGQPFKITLWRAAQTLKQLLDKLHAQARSGDASAMNMLSYMHGRGIGLTKNTKQAFSWTQKAANTGEPHAMSQLGAKYAYGIGTPKDDQKAVSWYKKAASKGNSRAMNSLGFMYSVGRGTSKDLRQAASWFTKAATLGNLSASFNLARAYARGNGVERDDKTAAQYMIKTLRGRHPTAVKQMTGNAKAWSIAFRQELQRQMKTQGHYTGLINGKFGPDTSRAIKSLIKNSPPKSQKQPAPKPVGKTMYVAYPELHVFPKPDLQATRIGSLYKNDEVLIKQSHDSQSGRWVKVCAKKKGLCGWVGADFLEDTP